MVRLVYILSSGATLAAGGVFGLWWSERSQADLRLETIRSQPSAIYMFRVQSNEPGVRSTETLPLIIEAQAFEQHLNPPKSPEKLTLPVSSPVVNSAPSAPVVRPPAPSVRFKVCATSYYPNEPGRSMALISDVGSPEGDQRWVKEGARLGHFVIHEIRRGMIVYRDGEQLREMAVERGTPLPRLVRDPRPASPTALAATPAKPDNIEIGGTERISLTRRR